MVRSRHRSAHPLVDEPTAPCVCHRLEPVVRAELAVDVVQVVAERVRGDAQRAGDRCRAAAVGEEPEDAKLLIGPWLDGCVIGRSIGERHPRPRDPVGHKFQIHLRGIIDLLSKHLYSGPEVFVRELLQNGVDAIRARQKLAPDFGGSLTLELHTPKNKPAHSFL